MLADFIQEQKAKDDLDRSLRDLRSHFVSWCKSNKKDYSQVSNTAKPKEYVPVTDNTIDYKAEFEKFSKKNPDAEKKIKRMIVEAATEKGRKRR